MRLHPSRPSSIVFSALLAASLAATSAAAAPFDAVFNGPADGGGQNFGLSASSASAAQAAGVPLVVTDIFDTAGVINVVDQGLGGIHPSQFPTPFETDSTWTIESAFGSTLAGSVYLVFTTTDPRSFTLNGVLQTVEYEDSLAGLELDPSNGWTLIQESDPQLGTLFYPAINLGSLDPGQQKSFVLRYHLEEIHTFPDGNDTFLPLPSLRIAVAFVPVPEPGTGFLLALGLAGLATRARKRS
jgi:hypothetical protein